jgi:hypothetical protein
MLEGLDFDEHANVFNQLIADLLKVNVKIDVEDRVIIPRGLMIPWFLH